MVENPDLLLFPKRFIKKLKQYKDMVRKIYASSLINSGTAHICCRAPYGRVD